MPTATYRIQFHRDFPFSAAIEIIPYLRDLGVSHLYSSPILAARPGSMHGYDTVDYATINPELGGEAGFIALSEALRAAGIGIILDIVPNHMAITGGFNRLWQDVLRHGRESRHARWFDIDFDLPDARLRGRVHLPFLGATYREVLASGDLKLERGADGTHAIHYGEHVFPIRSDVEPEIALRGLSAYADHDQLDALIARQHYVLDWWRNAGDRINWRRFFDVTELAAVRMEEPEAFNACHAIPLRLYRDGYIDGLRIDHIDGLTDPTVYCRQLRTALDTLQAERPGPLKNERAWLVVEKILSNGEAIQPDWDVDGSTGYDFMDEVSALQHDPAAEPVLAALWEAVSGRQRAFEPEETQARREILEFGFASQFDHLIDQLIEAGPALGQADRPSRHALERAATLLFSQMRAYRTYATGANPDAGPYFAEAIEKARAAVLRDDPALDYIAAIIGSSAAGEASDVRSDAIRRFNQLSAPLAAKAVEDTAFYRYGRLLSRNDVGFDASLLGTDAATFHSRMETRVKTLPISLLATATHDHKRGEDVRARLAVISEMPEIFAIEARAWLAESGASDMGIDPADAYMALQTIVGAWDPLLSPDDEAGLTGYADRLCGWMTKALREGKLRSSWSSPNTDYEARVIAFLRRNVCEPAGKAARDRAFAFVERLARAGAANGLVQTALRLTAPGLPDTYQGTEFWDFSLVDPDNRRPVDFAARRAALHEGADWTHLSADWRDGRVKQALMHRLLQVRREDAEIFAKGAYLPIRATGARADSVVAFIRRHRDRGVLVIATRLIRDGLTAGRALTPDGGWWGDTGLDLASIRSPAALKCEAVIGQSFKPASPLRIADTLGALPVGVWRVSGL